MKPYTHLSIYEREKIAIYKEKGYSTRRIAKILNRHHSTIARELKRNTYKNEEYSPFKAQSRYKAIRRILCGRKRLIDTHPNLKEQLRKCILEYHWSPEQTANRMKFEGFDISTNTIYNYIDDQRLENLTHYNQKDVKKSLRRKGRKRRKKVHGRTIYSTSKHITERPKEANDRTELGHWEADTVLGKNTGNCLVTLVDRKSRSTRIYLIESKTSEAVKDALINQFKNEKHLKSITPDRGSEFSKYQEISEALNVDFYFPDAGRPQDRGTNENTNGLIREFLPKGKSMDKVTVDEIKKIEDDLNNRPRKILGWLTPNEVYYGKQTRLLF